MIVKELIEKLQSCAPDDVVAIDMIDRVYSCFSFHVDPKNSGYCYLCNDLYIDDIAPSEKFLPESTYLDNIRSALTDMCNATGAVSLRNSFLLAFAAMLDLNVALEKKCSESVQ